MPEPSDELKEQIGALMQSGRKIEAIKVLREETGYSLLEAKNWVEAHARGENPADPGGPGSTGDFEQELVELLRRDKKIDAIKYFRQETGAGLKDAHDAMRELAARHNIPFRSGCAGVFLLAICAGLWLLSRI